MSDKPRIIFMGTPEFATASLGALLMNGYNIVGVVTAPDKPSGRGKKIKSSAISDFADEKALDTCLFKTSNLKDPGFVTAIENLNPDIIVVVAFRMLPEEIWKIPRFGTFNLHASLLPQYRGAAPINHAIINGETTTGITTFLIDDQIDTGKILLRSEVHISHDDNAGTLHNRLMREGAKLVVNTVKRMLKGNIIPIDQNQYISELPDLKPAPKIFPEDCYIKWNKTAEEIHNLVRGLAPNPGARTKVKIRNNLKTIKIRLTEIPDETLILMPGQIKSDGKRFLLIGTSSKAIRVIQLQPEGKKVMKTDDFLRGIDINEFEIISDLQA